MFSKKPESTARPPSNGAMTGSTFSVLGPDIVINGDLSAKVDLHLDGKIDGNVSCAALVQGETGEVVTLDQQPRTAGRAAQRLTQSRQLVQGCGQSCEGNTSHRTE